MQYLSVIRRSNLPDPWGLQARRKKLRLLADYVAKQLDISSTALNGLEHGNENNIPNFLDKGIMIQRLNRFYDDFEKEHNITPAQDEQQKTLPFEAPDYYKGNDDIDILSIIDNFNLNFSLGNVLKYIVRAGKKEGNDYLADLLKAKNYLEREIIRVKP